MMVEPLKKAIIKETHSPSPPKRDLTGTCNNFHHVMVQQEIFTPEGGTHPILDVQSSKINVYCLQVTQSVVICHCSPNGPRQCLICISQWQLQEQRAKMASYFSPVRAVSSSSAFYWVSFPTTQLIYFVCCTRGMETQQHMHSMYMHGNRQ